MARPPFRRIIQVLRAPSSRLESALVLLECGHQASSVGRTKARCPKCKTPRGIPQLRGPSNQVRRGESVQVEERSVFVSQFGQRVAARHRPGVRTLELRLQDTGARVPHVRLTRIVCEDWRAVDYVADRLQALCDELDGTVLRVEV